MILYKYLPSSRLDVLTASEIRFTQLGDFNDPFELRPNIDGLTLPEDLDDLLSRCFSRLVQEEYDGHPEVHTLLTKEDFLRLAKGTERTLKETIGAIQSALVPSLSDELRRAVNQTLGALSLSEVGNHQLMWAHYAEGHLGYALGFDSSSSFFQRKISEDDELRHLRKVSYTAIPPRMAFKDLTAAELFFVKGQHWRYEAEWRMLRPLSDSSRTIPCTPFPIHLFRFPPEAVSQVIIGAKMTEKNRRSLESFIASRDEYRHVSLWRASVDPADAGYEMCLQQLRLY